MSNPDTELVVALTGMSIQNRQSYPIAAFVLQMGISMTPPSLPLPAGMPKGKVGDCYSNCFTWKYKNQDSPLVYCEGYAIGRLGIPVLHAWLVDPSGKVVDPTWCGESDYDDTKEIQSPTPGLAYYGVPFEFDYVIETCRESRYFGVIENHRDNYSLITRWYATWLNGSSFTEGIADTWMEKIQLADLTKERAND